MPRVGAAVGLAVGAAVGAAVGCGVLASVTGTVSPSLGAPFVTAGTPVRPSHVFPASTIAALTTYVAAGSMIPGSYVIWNAMGVVPGAGMTWRATSVPVFVLTRIA